MKRLAVGLSILALLLVAAAPPAQAQNISQYAKTVSATSTNTVVSFGLNAYQIAVANDGGKVAYASLAGVAVYNDTASVAIAACETGIWTIPRIAAPVTSINIVTQGADTATVRVAAFTYSNLSSPSLQTGSAQPLFTKIIHCSPNAGAISATSITTSGNSTTSGTETVTGAVIANGGIQGNFNTFALTSGAAAATFVKVAVPALGWVNGLVHYVYEVTDGTEVQAFGGVIPFNAVNKAGTVTCTVGVVTTATQAALAASSGTLTNAITCADGTSGTVAIKATDTTSLTATTNRIRYNVEVLAASAPVTVTAQ